MEQLINAFGIDVQGIVVQIVNFAILAGVLTYFLYNPVLKVLRDREEKINLGLKHAEEAEVLKQNAEAEKQLVLSAANQEAEQVALRAKEYADEKSASIIAGAESKADEVIKNAEARGEEIKSQAQKESEEEIAKLAILGAEKVLRQRES